MLVRRIAVLAVVFCSAATAAFAGVKQVTITKRTPWLNGQVMGAAGAYEKLEGRILFAVDPKAPANQRIADIDLAPRNAEGLVEFSADFVVLRPINPAKARGSVVLEILNRGNTQSNGKLFRTDGTPFRVENLDNVKLSDAFVFEQGFTFAWVGWQYDLPKADVRIDVPVAPVNSLVREAIFPSVANIATGVYTLPAPTCAADSQQAMATMTVKQAFDEPGQAMPRGAWSFARMSSGAPTPDACSIYLPGGFRAGRLYEIVYTGVSPAIAGLGFAAVRDFASYLKFGGVASPLREHPATEQRILASGYSQTGRFLRDFLYQGFNADEQGRKAIDAMMISSAGAGRGSFNHRYAMPGQQGNSVLNATRPIDVFPFTDGDETDPTNGKRDGLLDEANRTKTLPKIFYTYSSTEYWARIGSLAYTSVDGREELPLDHNARLYLFSGAPHSTGPFPPTKGNFANDVNFASAGWGFRALLLDLDAWVTLGEPPPPSVYPHPGKDLVEREKVSFPRIPGVDFPAFMPQNWRMDYGPDFATKGIITQEPPRLGAEFTVLVPQVNADGNDLGGIALPMIAAPLGTFTGWNIQVPVVDATFHYLGGLTGGFVPFPLTAEARKASGDARLSIAERYKDRADYLAQVRAAARKLVPQRFLRAEDIPAIELESGRYWDVLTASAPTSQP